jgi:alkanesulfonate monooxygenase SsuD/methylene tetrahydromethanopterin reductase-like flavin-dependent oxidoreductase (luciferase family)
VQASHAYPKPAGGKVRILVGGAGGPKLLSQVTDYADGWMPIGGRGLAEAVPRLRAAWEEAGRGPGQPVVVPTAVQPSPGKLAHYRDLGIDEVIAQLPPGDEGQVLRTLDDYAQYL